MPSNGDWLNEVHRCGTLTRSATYPCAAAALVAGGPPNRSSRRIDWRRQKAADKRDDTDDERKQKQDRSLEKLKKNNNHRPLTEPLVTIHVPREVFGNYEKHGAQQQKTDKAVDRSQGLCPRKIRGSAGTSHAKFTASRSE